MGVARDSHNVDVGGGIDAHVAVSVTTGGRIEKVYIGVLVRQLELFPDCACANNSRLCLRNKF